jgi:diguanylate cyclase (GGDEF)-like protein
MNSIAEKLGAGFACALILLAAIGWVAYASITSIIDMADSVIYAHETLVEIEATLSTIKDVETGQRGYIITGDDAYLQPYKAARSRVDRRLSRLRQLTADNPRQQRRLAALEPMIGAKFAELAQTIELRKRDSFDAAQQVILTNRGKREMDAARRAFAAMERAEKALLARRSAHLRGSIQRTILSFVILFGLIVALLGLIYFLIRRDIAEHRRMEAELRELATRDALTGLYNRREMDLQLKDEVARFHRYQHPVTLMLLDIDHFKPINDAHGHQIGDEILQWVARNLRQAVRAVDIPARYGGDELAVILPEITSRDAFALGERLRRRIAAHPFISAGPTGDTLRIPVTISMGLAEMSPDIDSDERLVKAADQALYLAKHRGRNRVAAYAA